MTNKGSVKVGFRQASARLRWTLLVVLMIVLLALALMGFLGFVLVPLFFLLGGAVDH